MAVPTALHFLLPFSVSMQARMLPSNPNASRSCTTKSLKLAFSLVHSQNSSTHHALASRVTAMRRKPKPLPSGTSRPPSHERQLDNSNAGKSWAFAVQFAPDRTAGLEAAKNLHRRARSDSYFFARIDLWLSPQPRLARVDPKFRSSAVRNPSSVFVTCLYVTTCIRGL